MPKPRNPEEGIELCSDSRLGCLGADEKNCSELKGAQPTAAAEWRKKMG
jgi:hypothetical protein